MSGVRVNGRYTAANSFKCPECRQLFDAGEQFIVYCGPGVEPNTKNAAGWWGCDACSGIYADLATSSK